MLQAIKKYRWEATAMLLFLVYAFALNLQLPDGSNLHTDISAHDEYLTVRQVYNILEPASWKHFVMAVISGEKLYYGRIMFYTDAAVAFLPYKIWGLPGMVIAIRMVHAILLLLALFVLGRNFLSKLWMRGCFYLFGILGIYSAYFMMLPKPEPFQLFFLALFFAYWKRANWSFGRHFIWLGIAYGVKFNIVVLIPVFLFVAWFANYKQNQGLKVIGSKLLVTLMWLLLGFVVANPCMALAPIKPQFLQTYLDHTFYNTGQTDDIATTNWTDWLFHGYAYYYWGHNILVSVFLVLVVVAVAFTLRHFINTKAVSNALVIGISAVGLFLPIILFTKRLWPHYLWAPHLLFLLVFFIVAQEMTVGRKTIQIAFTSLLMLCLAFQGTHFLFFQAPGFFGLNRRYADEKENWTQIKKYLIAKKADAKIIQDGGLWYPFAEFVKINRYHPFSGTLEEDPKEPRITWELPDDPRKPGDHDFLVLKKMIPELAAAGGSPDLLKQDAVWKRQMQESIPEVWTKDTVMHGISIYRRSGVQP
jgi:hypothetical protein